MSRQPIILAVSSPPGPSARGIIRITGDDLLPLIATTLDLAPTARRLTRCILKARGLPSSGAPDTRHAIHLSVLAILFPVGSSFTGSDTLELQLPGNPALLERVLHALLDAAREHDPDARLAEPGEFTRRAFAAGRIDLTRAEGIAATIGATTDAQLRAAGMLRTGRLGRWSADLVDSLGQSLALVEAGIDFVDQDDVVPIAPGELDARLAVIESELRGLLAKSRSWSSLESLPWVVLVGPPNAGKSTLLNALLGRDRAVVSDIAGTTRDVLAEPMLLNPPPLGRGRGREAGVLRVERDSHGKSHAEPPRSPSLPPPEREGSEVMLVDIAGLDAPRAMLDEAMQQTARDAIERADLIVRLGDALGVDLPIDTPVIDVVAKCDLIAADETPPTGLRVSAKTGEGLDALRAAIAAAVRDRAVSLSAEMFALRPRHRAELDAALTVIAAARALLAPQRNAAALSDMELIADRMRCALNALGALGGAMTPDDVIGKVFATFCVGK